MEAGRSSTRVEARPIASASSDLERIRSRYATSEACLDARRGAARYFWVAGASLVLEAGRAAARRAPRTHRRYLAPEILENRGHGTAVDWWSYGTLLYEMMCGLPPFYDTNVQRMYNKILVAPLRFPSYISPEAKSALQGLLQRAVEDRLGLLAARK